MSRPSSVSRSGQRGRDPRRRESSAKAWWLLLLLLLLFLGATAYLLRDLLFPPEPTPPPPEPETVVTGSAVPAKPKPKVAKLPPSKPIVPESQRQLLLKAIQSRASELKACGRPPGSPSRLLTRIGVTQPGPVKAVAFSGEAAPKPLTDCVRQKVLGWNFADVKLTSDVEILVSFSL